ncbi:MAG TPA: imidazole glycerol phosphate synthase subunit HisH [Hyphomonas sp.]|nr:imidazole glycerol phosphate synthase subunit HisH [Hyphomonas sp.]
MINIVDYGASNARSIVNMLNKLNIKAIITANPDEIEKADRIILPGVGHFQHGMSAMRASGVVPALTKRVMESNVPVLGICLGAQFMLEGSEESEIDGLGWVPGKSVRFREDRLGSKLRVPHMGWADTVAIRNVPPFTPLEESTRFYYVHSYHFACSESSDVFLSACHGEPFEAGFVRGNIVGVQFHPEKSHRFGMQFLRAFASWRPLLS